MTVGMSDQMSSFVRKKYFLYFKKFLDQLYGHNALNCAFVYLTS